MSDYVNVTELFGCDVFNDAVMEERLPKKVYKELKKTIEEGKELSLEVADVVAHEMKEWAIEKGATHYSHWFQPLTGVTAEKHDAFITAPKENDFEQHLKQEVILHGIVLHRHLYVMMQLAELCVSRLHSALIQEKHLIRRHRFFVLWKQSIHSLYVFFAFLAIQLQRR